MASPPHQGRMDPAACRLWVSSAFAVHMDAVAAKAIIRGQPGVVFRRV